ncbi:MAG: lysophospholipid acyltransferase family protein [Acidobacteriota bacterium]
MKKPLRLTFRLLTIGASTLGLYLLWLTGLPLVFAFKNLRYSWRNWIFRTWGKTLARFAGLRLTIEGTPPRAPFFLVSNHLSYTDIIVFASQLDCVFVSKSDVKDWPGIGFLARSMGIIFIDRTRKQDIPRVIELIENAWQKRQGVVVFPEGTSSKGDTVLPFKPSLLEPAVKTGLPVSYASISYQTPPDEPPAHLSVCWWGDMEFASHAIALFRLRRIDAKVVFGEQTFSADDRKILAQRLRAAIIEQFTPVVTTEEECQITLATTH